MASDLSSTRSYTQSIAGKAGIAAVNSTVLYVLAYLLVQALFHGATVGMAGRLSIGGVWRLSGIQFRMADSAWWPAAVVQVYGVGPLVSLGVGLGAAVWFWKLARQRRGLLKLFLFWVMLHGCNLALGALAVDTLTQSGVWYVPSWLFMAGNILNVLLALLAALLQTGLGYLAAVPFLHSHDSITLMQYHNRRWLLLATLVTPWLVGSLLLAALQWPEQLLNEWLRVLSMLLLLGPLYMAAANEAFAGAIRFPGKTRVAAGLLLLLVLILLVWRLALSRGILFG